MNAPVDLEGTTLDKLIKMMRLTESDTDAEALAALRAANRLIRNLKTDWDAVLRGKISIIADPFGGIPVVTKSQPAPPPPPPPPRPAPQPQPAQSWTPNPPRPRPAPPPPPPPKPKVFPHTDATEINGYFAMVKMRKWSKTTLNRIINIQQDWRQFHGLDHTDYDFLKQCALGLGAPSTVNDL